MRVQYDQGVLDFLFDASEWRYVAAGVGLVGFFLWESLAPSFRQRKRGLHATRNLTIAAINGVLVALCCAAATVAVAAWAEARQLGLLHTTGLSPLGALAAGFVVMDLWTYWWHRLNHRVPLLWRLHKTHHSDPAVDVTTSLRFHGGELLVSAALRLALIPMLGLSLAAIALYGATVSIIAQFHHANISLVESWDRFVRLFVVSPSMHKVHHSRVRIETDSNYATVFSLWDRLFGTYRRRESYDSIQFGLDHMDGERFQSLKGLLMTPLYSEQKP